MDDTFFTEPVEADIKEVATGDDAAEQPEALNEVGDSAPADEKPEGEVDVKEEVEKDAEKEEDSGDFEIDIPEGLEIDKESFSAFKAAFEENLTKQELAQRMFDMYSEEINKFQNGQVDAVQKQTADWLQELDNIPEFSGDKREKAVNLSQNAMRQFAGTEEHLQELKHVLEASGLGNNPSIFRLLHNIGKGMGEAGGIVGGASVAEKSIEERLYPS